MRSFLRVRAEAWRGVVEDVRQTPWSSLFGAAVVAVALALPAAFYGLASTISTWAGHLDRGEQISVYLHRNVSNIAATLQELRQRPDVAAVQYVSPAQGLSELSASGQFGNLLELLPHNPVPPVLVVSPRTGLSPQALAALSADLGREPGVAAVDADLEWARRLSAALAVARRVGIVLAAAFAAMIMVVLGNTARLQILSRRSDIELMRLVGATPSYIRRPFVYAGFLTGLAGGALGWLILALAESLVAAPVARLSALYASAFHLAGPDWRSFVLLCVLGALLGGLGARAALGQHLQEL